MHRSGGEGIEVEQKESTVVYRGGGEGKRSSKRSPRLFTEAEEKR